MELIVPDVKIDFKELISGFTLPNDIQNDIIYCQKNLRTYIKVHQMIVARMGNSLKLSTVRKKLDELEREICEINAEQKLLVIRLRCALEDYYISLRNDNIHVDPEIGNGYISRVFSKFIDDPGYLCEPIMVKSRINEKDLLAKYMPDIEESIRRMQTEPSIESVRNALIGNARQISLLKPKSERFAQRRNFDIAIMKRTNFDNKDYKPQLNVKKEIRKESQTESQIESQQQEQQKEKDEKPITITLSSPAINTSRMRLLQALQKAQTMNALKTKQQSSVAAALAANKRNYETNSPQSSTSDESPDTRETSPTLSEEPPEPTEYTQEMFLKIFGLYTLEQSKYLAQRRSKRKRRNVQNNEKSDFHYGNLDLLDTSDIKPEKRKKEYLPSTTVTRGKKRKLDSDKDTATSSKVSSDRSSSSSPTDEKIYTCNECFKERGDSPLCRCAYCNGMFHLKCQKGPIIKQSMKFRERCCLICYRVKQKDATETRQQQQQEQQKQLQPSVNRLSALRLQSIALIGLRNKIMKEYNDLQQKYEGYYIRNQGLVKKSDMYKTKLNNLFHIVKKFKEKP